MRSPAPYAHLHQISPSNSRARYRMSILPFACRSCLLHHPVAFQGSEELALVTSLSCTLRSLDRPGHTVGNTLVLRAILVKFIRAQLSLSNLPNRCLRTSCAHARYGFRFTSPFAAVRGGSSDFSLGGTLDWSGRPGRVWGLVGSETGYNYKGQRETDGSSLEQKLSRIEQSSADGSRNRICSRTWRGPGARDDEGEDMRDVAWRCEVLGEMRKRARWTRRARGKTSIQSIFLQKEGSDVEVLIRPINDGSADKDAAVATDFMGVGSFDRHPAEVGGRVLYQSVSLIH
ncbi:hypothetical protein R3P38DRAFT_2815189 [Favolaschia claudopus]|uniref:Uncharacterized protein n=1 Tax=Favolaschia claudopus TaxID=2862362 RepID=A0AAV9Z209_9AGAR